MLRAEEFFTFMREREAIRLRRASGQQWPWTDDPILQRYKFTNIDRAHDRTSRELIVDQYTSHQDAPRGEILWNAAVYRYFGTSEFTHAVGWSKPGEDSLRNIQSIATERMRLKLRTFTGAYIVTNAGLKGAKESVICRVFLADLLRQLDDVVQTAESDHWNYLCYRLQKVHGFGGSGFIAKEVILDTMYTNFWRAGVPADWLTWTATGPGSARGAARVTGLNTPGAGLPAPATLETCLELYEVHPAYWPAGYITLSPHSMQWVLCEFDKYERVRLGQGRPRSLYKLGRA